jgi:hypothetical protein
MRGGMHAPLDAIRVDLPAALSLALGTKHTLAATTRPSALLSYISPQSPEGMDGNGRASRDRPETHPAIAPRTADGRKLGKFLSHRPL